MLYKFIVHNMIYNIVGRFRSLLGMNLNGYTPRTDNKHAAPVQIKNVKPRSFFFSTRFYF